MKMYIPRLGDKIRLSADWTFRLYDERRNATMMEHVGDTRDPEWSYGKQFTAIPCTIPAGTELKIERIFIRKGADEFDSVSFTWPGMRTKRKEKERTITAWRGHGNPIETHIVVDKIPARPVRFWAKLDDVNTIEFDHV